MAFLPTLQEVHNEHIRYDNQTCIEAVEAILKEAVVPIQQMREALLVGARKGQMNITSATYSIDLSRLLQYKEPLCMYVAERNNVCLTKIIFDPTKLSTYGVLIRILLRNRVIFKEIDRIYGEIQEAFPDGTLSMDVETSGAHSSAKISMEFYVSYPIQTPKGVPIL